jgi:hypothetical protein
MNITCFPVICNKLPTEPEKELINLPQDKKINAATPILNLSPKRPNKNSGKIKNIHTNGIVDQKINFVD